MVLGLYEVIKSFRMHISGGRPILDTKQSCLFICNYLDSSVNYRDATIDLLC